MDENEYNNEHNGENGSEDIINNVNGSVCSYASCGRPMSHSCDHCGQYFCDSHTCMMHPKTLSSQREPIVDEDGTQHKGERIRLIGEGWPNQLSTIEAMSDEQIVEFITVHQQRLKQAMETATYEQISVAHASYVLGARQHSRYVKAMRHRQKHDAAKQGILNLGKKKLRTPSGQTIPSDIDSLMRNLGISYEVAVATKSVLSASKKV